MAKAGRWFISAPVVLVLGLVGLLVGLFGGLSGCGSGETDRTLPLDPSSELEEGLEPEDLEGSEIPQTPLTATDLAPVIREVTADGGRIKRLVVVFARAVVDSESVGNEIQLSGREDARRGGTILDIEPSVEGALVFTDPATLAFQPSEPFRPGATYQVALRSVATRSGVIDAPSDSASAAAAAWRHSFQVPPFRFTRMDLVEWQRENGRATVELRFNAPVSRSAVADAARFSLYTPGGRRIVPRAHSPNLSEPNAVRMNLRSAELRPGARIELELASTALGVDGASVEPPAVSTIELASGPELSIKAAVLEESAAGFYVHVVCDDSAVEGRRWYWSQRTSDSYQVSTRCELADESVDDHLRFEPPISGLTTVNAEGGFKIFGDFDRGSYTMTIAGGATSTQGSPLDRPFELDLTVSARSPQVQLLGRGRYLPRTAWGTVPVRHLNIDRATLLIRHVRPENLIFWMSEPGSERATERTSDLIVRTEVALTGEVDVEATSYLDLGAQVSAETKGLLEVTLVSGPARSSARVLLTDLLMVAKRTGATTPQDPGEEVVVWVLDNETLRPAKGVDVELVKQSGQAVDVCRTDGEGGCRLEVASGVDPSAPFALVAKRSNDISYLAFDELKTDIQDTRIAGARYRQPGGYRAAVYAERGVYRPGETAHVAMIVRGEDRLAPAAGMPIELQLFDPQGKMARKLTQPVNPAGFATADFLFPAFATTGRYEVRVTAGKRAIGSTRFQVEEFVPERLKVEVAPTATDYLQGDEMAAAIEARYLFGGTPKGAPVELDCALEPATFEPEENAEFHFGVWTAEERPQRPLPLGVVSASLDDEGNATVSCPAQRASGLRGPARLVARAAVAEAGSGRTTVRQATAPVHPERFYLGLKSGTQKLEAGERAVVEGMVVDWQGKRGVGPSEVEVELVRLDWEWGLFFDETRGRETYQRYERPVTEQQVSVAVRDGRFETELQTTRSAVGYLIRAKAGEARTDLYVEGDQDGYYWSPQDSEADLTPRPGRPTWVAITAPERVRVGERVELRFTAPYRGRALVSLETDQLVDHRWLDVEPGETVWRTELDDFVSNVYASVFVIKDPHLESDDAYLPDRAFGVVSIPVEPSEFTAPLQLDVPSEVRSSSNLVATLDLGRQDPENGPSYATVAVVDQGILSLTGYESPNPFSAVFPRRALGVETFETVGWTMMLPPVGPSSVTGGGRAGLLGRAPSIEPVALWSGLREIPADGKLEVGFFVPEYRGELRVMAVTADRKRLGRAEATVTVRDPLVLDTTLPRFLTQHDEVEIPAFITNLSGGEREIELRLTARPVRVAGLEAARGIVASDVGEPGTGLLEIIGSSTGTLSLADGDSGVVRFRVRAVPAAGAVEVEVEAVSGQLVSRDSRAVPLLPRGQKSRRIQRVALHERTGASDSPSRSVDLRPLVEGWQPLSERTTFWVTNNPYGDALQHLGYLIRYPYGCLEQTTSSTRPLLHLTRLIDLLDPEITQDKDVDQMVQRGVDRLLAMQTPSGGFAYWIGGSEPAKWASAYALHLLLDAQRLEYQVPQERLDDALDWMERQLSSDSEAFGDHYRGDGRPYMHYVLAVAGRSQRARAARLLEQLNRADFDAGEKAENRFLLIAALQLSGDHRYENELKRPDLSQIASERSYEWSFYSDRRRRGLMLSTMVDLFGRDPAVEPLADLVAEALRSQRSGYYTTQELVWGVTGLGKFVEVGATLESPPTLTANGVELAAETSDVEGNWSWKLDRASEYRQLGLELPDRSSGALYLVVSSEGVPTVPERRVGGEGLLLERRYRRASGEVFDPSTQGLELGELVHVEIEVENRTAERLTNVALVDRVAAGLEIENPRLGRGREVSWVDADQLWLADHLDVRDDRIELFGALEPRAKRKLVYSARATAAGRFTLPGVTAEAMYNPAVWAQGADAPVVIRRDAVAGSGSAP